MLSERHLLIENSMGSSFYRKLLRRSSFYRKLPEGPFLLGRSLQVLYLYKAFWRYSIFLNLRSSIYIKLSGGLLMYKKLPGGLLITESFLKKIRFFQSPLKGREHKLQECKTSQKQRSIVGADPFHIQKPLWGPSFH